MKMKRLLCLSLFFVLGACSMSSDDRIAVGVILPLSGPVSDCGENIQQGMELAKTQLGLEHVVFHYEDNKFSPKDSVTAARNFVDRGMRMLIGSCNSSATLAMAPVAEGSNVVLITPVSGADTISDAGDNVFRLAPRTSTDGLAMANFLENMPYEKIGFLYMNNDFGKQYADYLEAYFREGQKSLVYREALDIAVKDMRSELAQLVQEGVEILAAAPTPAQGVIMLQQMMELGIELPLVFARSAEYAEVKDVLVHYPGDSYFVTTSNQLTDAFDALILEKDLQEFLNDQFLGGFDTVYVLDYVFAQCPTQEVDCMKKALYTIKDVRGSRGEIRIDENGDIELMPDVIQFKNAYYEEE